MLLLAPSLYRFTEFLIHLASHIALILTNELILLQRYVNDGLIHIVFTSLNTYLISQRKLA